MGPEFYSKGVLRKMNKNVKPEFVVVLGDLIEHENKENDKKNINYIIKLFEKIKCPIHYVAGNHDQINLSEEDLIKLFHQDKLYYSFDSENFHFIVLFSKLMDRKRENSLILEYQKNWLKKDLEKTNKKSIVFVHHALADQNLMGNPW